MPEQKSLYTLQEITGRRKAIKVGKVTTAGVGQSTCLARRGACLSTNQHPTPPPHHKTNAHMHRVPCA